MGKEKEVEGIEADVHSHRPVAVAVTTVVPLGEGTARDPTEALWKWNYSPVFVVLLMEALCVTSARPPQASFSHCTTMVLGVHPPLGGALEAGHGVLCKLCFCFCGKCEYKNI